jgi:2'-5' RNA ligase
MRLFVAIVPPPAAVAELAGRLAALRPAAPPGVRWASPDSWHVTLAFLGEVPEPVLPALTARLERAARRHPVRWLAIRGGGAFPGAARARVIWAGVQVLPPGVQDLPPGDAGREAAASGRPRRPRRPGALDGLGALAASAAAGARRAGAPPPAGDRRFRAHLTLARLSQPADVGPLVADLAAFAGQPWRASVIRLIRSHPGGSPPGPPRYEELGRWPLRDAPRDQRDQRD